MDVAQSDGVSSSSELTHVNASLELFDAQLGTVSLLPTDEPTRCDTKHPVVSQATLP